ncbi:MAG: HIT domain-containing protein [Pseudomonadota bacterium]|nr:HIT domain-containing protein [Pseudomonadota bacterium]
MFIAADGDDFRRQFSDGLSQMLSADGLGAFILVLANSLQGDELRQPLQHALEKNFDAMKTAGQGSEDDESVFAILATEGIEDQQCWRHRQVGSWELLYNNMRRLRPERLSTQKFDAISQPFDDRRFNFNRPFLQPEILWQGEWSGRHFRVLYNKFPFAPWHLLIVPNAQAQRPQYLDFDSHAMIWQLVSAQQQVMPGFGIGYNSLGAGASVNHLHFQGFLRSEPLPVESQCWRHHGGDQPYPLKCRVEHSAEQAWQMIEQFQQHNQPFNLLYRPGICYLLPRLPQGAVAAEPWAQGIAWYESCGVFTLADQALFTELTQQQITQQLGLFAHPMDD